MTAEIIGDRVAALRMVVSPPKLERLIASLGARAGGRPGPWDGPGHFRHRRGRREAQRCAHIERTSLTAVALGLPSVVT